jgi:nucleoside-diphosphate-sugar epimerase
VPGITPLQGNLDQPATLARLAGLATRVVHLAPPPAMAAAGRSGGGHAHHGAAARLRLRTAPAALVYGSTSGVYGDCGGARVSEARAVAPARRARSGASMPSGRCAFFGRGPGVRASILRIPGIYAPDREGGTPRERLLRGTPVLRRRTTSTPTTSMPTTWRAPAWRRCGAAGRSASTTPATTPS